jgi:hypothetical protein
MRQPAQLFAQKSPTAQKKSRPFEVTAGRSVERCLRMFLLVAKRIRGLRLVTLPVILLESRILATNIEGRTVKGREV